MLGFQWKLHVPYHPQSSGLVERTNSAIKRKLTKTMTSTGLKWPDALPLMLFEIWSTPNRRIGLRSHEVLMPIQQHK